MGARLETFESQPRALYLRQGYAKCAQRHDCLSSQSLTHLKKAID